MNKDKLPDSELLQHFYSNLSTIGECFSMGRPIGRPTRLSDKHFKAMVDMLYEMTGDMRKMSVVPTKGQLQKLVITVQMLGRVWLDVKGYTKESNKDGTTKED